MALVMVGMVEYTPKGSVYTSSTCNTPSFKVSNFSCYMRSRVRKKEPLRGSNGEGLRFRVSGS